MATDAERQRDYRKRLKAGVRCVTLPVDDAIIEKLIWRGWIDREESLDREKLAEAIFDLVDCTVRAQITAGLFITAGPATSPECVTHNARPRKD